MPSTVPSTLEKLDDLKQLCYEVKGEEEISQDGSLKRLVQECGAKFDIIKLLKMTELLKNLKGDIERFSDVRYFDKEKFWALYGDYLHLIPHQKIF
jgi:hypothetical protein